MIHDAIHSALTERPERAIDGKLWVSDLGKNPYFALRRIATGELEPFDYPTLLKMDNGNALEAASLRQIAENLPNKVRTQVPLFNGVWSGYADLVIEPHDSFESPVIVDHKGTGGRWWDYKESLPRAADCCQVWMYGKLYHDRYGVAPVLCLYYRGWGCWAEFYLEETHSGGMWPGFIITARGNITDEKGGGGESTISRRRIINPEWLAMELQNYYSMWHSGVLTLEQIEAMDPGGPDWDYAADNYDRLAEIYAVDEGANDGNCDHLRRRK